jgi:spore coat protein U-like protein
MSMRGFFRILLALWLLILPGQALALQCTGTVVPVVFAPVYGSPFTESGSGALDVSCDSGTGSETVHVCVTIGAGSGGGVNGANTRYLNGASPPVYTLFANGSSALPVGSKVGLGSITLSSGSGTGSFTLSGTIDWTGYSGGYSNLTSTFVDGVLLSYGLNADCTGTGGTAQVSGFSVSGSIYPSCSVDANNLDFGTLGASVTSAVDAQGSVVVNCTDQTAYTITLSQGLWPGNGPVTGLRAMKQSGGSGFISYDIFKDSARTEQWTSASGVSGTGSGANQTIDVFGRIPATQNGLSAGTYSDVVVVTVTY